MTTHVYHVENVKCGGCASSIRKRLVAIAGVHAVEVDADSGAVIVEQDNDLARELVVDALQKLGYPEAGTGGTMERIKSYVSCAVGRLQG